MASRIPKRVNIRNADVSLDIDLDASISESHVVSTEVTDHPVESGAVISDHVIRKPVELEIEAIFTDYPLGGGLSTTINIKPGSEPTGAEARVEVQSSLLSDVAQYGQLGGLAPGPIGAVGGTITLGAAALAKRLERPPTVSIVPGKPGSSPQITITEDDPFPNVTIDRAQFEGKAKYFYGLLKESQAKAELLKVTTAFESYENMIITNLSAPRSSQVNQRTVKFNMHLREIVVVESQTVKIKPVPKLQPKVSEGPKDKKDASQYRNSLLWYLKNVMWEGKDPNDPSIQVPDHIRRLGQDILNGNFNLLE